MPVPMMMLVELISLATSPLAFHAHTLNVPFLVPITATPICVVPAGNLNREVRSKWVRPSPIFHLGVPPSTLIGVMVTGTPTGALISAGS
jgi:hypothetical protein